jgi:Zn-finger nucleic acid-binding protein
MLMCPNCGAAARTSDVQCGYCKAQLQTVSCPSCLGMIFRGAKHCSHCGARTFAEAGSDDAAGDVSAVGGAGAGDGAHRCPRCAGALAVTAIGSAFLEECGACGGVWVDAQSFQQICQSREQQSAYVGAGSPVAAPSLGAAAHHESVQYVKCPECGQLMNRMNFARHSGVVVDVCKRHGTWFDRDELRQIVEFIRGGGLDAARDKERAQLEVEKQRLKERERASASMPAYEAGDDRDYGGVIAAAGDLLRWILR